MSTPRLPRAAADELTPRQQQAAALLARNYTNARIAGELGISLDGAKYLVSEVIGRLGVETREEAADAWRARQGLATRLRRFAARASAAWVVRWAAVALMAAALAVIVFVVVRSADDDGTAPAGTETAAATEPTASTATPVPLSRSLGRLGVIRSVGGSARPYVMDVDGSNAVELTAGLAFVQWAAWEPSGARVAAWADEDPAGTNPGLWLISSTSPDDRQRIELPTELMDMAWSPDGSQIALALREGEASSDLYALSVDSGDLVRLTDTPGFENSPQWSPDGTQIAFAACRDCGAFFDIWVMDADGSNQRNLTPEQADRGAFSWSPDGTRIAYTAHGGGRPGLFVLSVDSGDEERIADGALVGVQPAWTPDGQQLVSVQLVEQAWVLVVMDRDGGSVETVTDPAFGSIHLPARPALSPDGRRVAYVRHQALWFTDLERRTEHRVTGPVSAVQAWFALEPGPGVTPGSLPPAVTPVAFEGDLQQLRPDEVDAEGWPKVECEAGRVPYRMETRRVSLCVPEDWSLRSDQEYTRDDFWGARVEWGGRPSAGFSLQVMERERSADAAGYFQGCDIQQPGMVMGVPAVVCSGTVDRPNGLGLGADNPLAPQWWVQVMALAPDYMFLVHGWDNDDATDAEARIIEAIEVAESARAADLGRVIP